ncbi:monovalent cation/H(+) antiporter subunit G [candidate division KSB1 bacterium]|nr:monovalent cation/H(+) antiporter subunit G [candidate division KSB1 bacterium]MBL7095066.1 monovalent cation/H(+) antiporter subunit G [candidate division KSB1 bacterium]
MIEIIVTILLISGAAFMLLAAIGITRMPDLFTRMQAATKAAALGASFIFCAVAFFFSELGVTTRAAATIIFIFLTAPVAAHMLGRAAYLLGVPKWEGTVTDELRDRYNLEKGTLSSKSIDSIKKIPVYKQP